MNGAKLIILVIRAGSKADISKKAGVLSEIESSRGRLSMFCVKE
jgi:hypothetical protein